MRLITDSSKMWIDERAWVSPIEGLPLRQLLKIFSKIRPIHCMTALLSWPVPGHGKIINCLVWAYALQHFFNGEGVY
jgi:hypothetical protein